MPASLPVIAGPLAQTAAPAAGGASARTAGRSAAPAFTERLEAALAQPTGAPQDTGLGPQATATGDGTGQPTEAAETATNPATTTGTPDTLMVLSGTALSGTVLSGAPATPPIGLAPAGAVAQADAGGPETTGAPIRAPSKPATSPARGGRSAATEPDPSAGVAAPDPTPPAGSEPVPSAVPQPPLTAISALSGGAHGTAHPTSDHGTAPAAPASEGPSRSDREPTLAPPQDKAPAAAAAEAPLAAPDATPTRSPTETATDPAKAAIGIANEVPSAEALIHAAEASQPTASPAGRATAASQPTADPPRADIASPAQQVAAPLVALGSGPDQSQRMTVRLDPAALGAVQVRIDRPKDGPARVEITVERPETLSLLLRDQPQLQRALDQAGIPSEGRSVVFQIATPDPQARNDTAFLDHRQSNGGEPQAGNGGTGEGYGGGGDGASSGRGRRDRADEDSSVFRFTPSAAQRRLRDGLDITA